MFFFLFLTFQLALNPVEHQRLYPVHFQLVSCLRVAAVLETVGNSFHKLTEQARLENGLVKLA